MYKTMLKHQTTFFTFSDDALAFFKCRFHVSTNDHGLYVLNLDGKFVASFKPEEKDDAILYYANRQVMRENAFARSSLPDVSPCGKNSTTKGICKLYFL